jgi:hypothetical protein
MGVLSISRENNGSFFASIENLLTQAKKSGAIGEHKMPWSFHSWQNLEIGWGYEIIVIAESKKEIAKELLAKYDVSGDFIKKQPYFEGIEIDGARR